MTSKNASGIYALRDGVAGITLVGCQSDMVPAGIPEAYAAGLPISLKLIRAKSGETTSIDDEADSAGVRLVLSPLATE